MGGKYELALVDIRKITFSISNVIFFFATRASSCRSDCQRTTGWQELRAWQKKVCVEHQGLNVDGDGEKG